MGLIYRFCGATLGGSGELVDFGCSLMVLVALIMCVLVPASLIAVAEDNKVSRGNLELVVVAACAL